MSSCQTADELADVIRQAYLDRDAALVAGLFHLRPDDDLEKRARDLGEAMDLRYEVLPCVVKPFVQPDWEVFDYSRFEPPPTHSIEMSLKYLEGIRLTPDIVAPPGGRDLYFPCAPGADGYRICYYVKLNLDERELATRDRQRRKSERKAIGEFEQLVQPLLAAETVDARQAVESFLTFYRETDFPEVRNSLCLEWGTSRPYRLPGFVDVRQDWPSMNLGPEELPWLHLMRVLHVGLEDSNPVLSLILYFDRHSVSSASGWLETSGRDELDSLLQRFYSNPHITQLLLQTPVSTMAFVGTAG